MDSWLTDELIDAAVTDAETSARLAKRLADIAIGIRKPPPWMTGAFRSVPEEGIRLRAQASARSRYTPCARPEASGHG